MLQSALKLIQDPEPAASAPAGAAESTQGTSEATAAGTEAASDTPLFDTQDWFGSYLGDGILEDTRVLGLVIVITACVFAKVLDWIVTHVVLRLAARTRLRIDDQVVALMHRPLVRSTIVIGLALAIRPFGLSGPLAVAVERILVTIAIGTWIPFAFSAASMLLRAASHDAEHFRAVGPTSYPLFDNLAKLGLFTAFAYAILISTWSVDPAGFLASAGIVGLAVGFAAQDTLANLFAGVFIIADAPYRVGDFITLDTGERGEVRHIGLRSTRLLTRDDIEITIPNSIMGAAKITNEAGGPSPSHRIGIDVSAAYGSDIDVVRRVLLESAAAVHQIVNDPAPRVRFRSFGDSGLNFRLLGWIKRPIDRGATLDQLHVDVYKRFAANGLEIPYPKRDVYMHHVGQTGDEDSAD